MAEESLHQNRRVFPALAPVFRSLPYVGGTTHRHVIAVNVIAVRSDTFKFISALGPHLAFGKFDCHLSHHSAAMVPETPQHAKSIPSFVVETGPCYTAILQWVALL